MNNVPLFSVGEHIFFDNVNTAFVIEINISKLRFFFKVHYIIDNTDKYNVAEEICGPVSIISESNSRRRLSTAPKYLLINLTPIL